jgi:hypothetical protein
MPLATSPQMKEGEYRGAVCLQGITGLDEAILIAVGPASSNGCIPLSPHSSVEYQLTHIVHAPLHPAYTYIVGLSGALTRTIKFLAFGVA